nr:MAG TPA: hypothetical protein [Inoviridae sp.]
MSGIEKAYFDMFTIENNFRKRRELIVEKGNTDANG